MEQVTIDDDDVLYRRLFYENIYPPHSKKTPGAVNSTAFTDHGDPLQQISVELARHTTPEDCLAGGLPGQGIATITVGEVRALGLSVHHTPGNGASDAHCDIEAPEGESITMFHCKRLAQLAKVLRSPVPRTVR